MMLDIWDMWDLENDSENDRPGMVNAIGVFSRESQKLIATSLARRYF
jgi:hypothetical protein